jgi:hypothetical protein
MLDCIYIAGCSLSGIYSTKRFLTIIILKEMENANKNFLFHDKINFTCVPVCGWICILCVGEATK